MNGEEDKDNSSPFFTDVIYKWLDVALDYGITELDFWDMTIGEVERAVESKKRVEKAKMQDRATLDYILSDLIGRSIARLYSSSATMPEIQDVYNNIFDEKEIEEKKQEKTLELSALRFKQFAQSYNNKYKEVAKDKC